MARSTENIYNTLLDDKAKESELDDLKIYSTDPQKPQKTSVWQNIYYTFASGIRTLELIFDKFTKEIQSLIDNQVGGTLPWYVSEAKRYQKGFDVNPDDGTFVIPDGTTGTQIENSKIVKQASATEGKNRTVTLKVFGQDKTDPANPKDKELSDEDIKSVQSFIDTIKFAGTTVEVVSLPKDILKIKAKIFRSLPYLIEVGGTDDLGENVIERAVNDYLKSLPYNSRLTVQGLSNFLEQVRGVDLVRMDEVNIKPYGKSFKNLMIQDKQEQIPASGFFKFEYVEADIQIV